MPVVPTTHRSFATRADLDAWLRDHHAKETELWVRVFKKGSGIVSVTWEDLVIAGLTWGWIDGLKKSLDEASFLQRMTPRRPKSVWSKKNCEHVERLIAEGVMQPQGLAHVEAAKKDGRWDQAYAGAADMVIPEDFLKALKKNAAAKKTYATLDRTNLYAIYHRLQTAKTPETRSRRIAKMIETLARGERFHEVASSTADARKPAPKRRAGVGAPARNAKRG